MMNTNVTQEELEKATLFVEDYKHKMEHNAKCIDSLDFEEEAIEYADKVYKALDSLIDLHYCDTDTIAKDLYEFYVCKIEEIIKNKYNSTDIRTELRHLQALTSILHISQANWEQILWVRNDLEGIKFSIEGLIKKMDSEGVR